MKIINREELKAKLDDYNSPDEMVKNITNQKK